MGSGTEQMLSLRLASRGAIRENSVLLPAPILPSRLTRLVNCWLDIIINDNNNFWRNLRDHFPSRFAARRLRYELTREVEDSVPDRAHLDRLDSCSAGEARALRQREESLNRHLELDSYAELTATDRRYADSYDMLFAKSCGADIKQAVTDTLDIKDGDSVTSTTSVSSADETKSPSADEQHIDSQKAPAALGWTAQEPPSPIATAIGELTLSEVDYVIRQLLQTGCPGAALRFWAALACSFTFYHLAIQPQILRLLRPLNKNALLGRYLLRYTIYLMYREESCLRHKSTTSHRHVTSLRQWDRAGLRKLLTGRNCQPPLPYPCFAQ